MTNNAVTENSFSFFYYWQTLTVTEDISITDDLHCSKNEIQPRDQWPALRLIYKRLFEEAVSLLV